MFRQRANYLTGKGQLLAVFETAPIVQHWDCVEPLPTVADVMSGGKL